MPGLVAMTSVFVVVGIEMFFASKGAGHVHSTDYETLGHDADAGLRPHHSRSHSYGRYSDGRPRANGQVPSIVLHDMESSEHLMGGRSPSLSIASPRTSITPGHNDLHQGSAVDDDDDSDLELSPEELETRKSDNVDPDTHLLTGSATHKQDHAHNHDHHDTADVSPEKSASQNQKLLLQCLLLEAGILFHSVFIGMALSVATGTSFIVLLVAISFHQTFEGFALGSRISAIRFPSGSLKPWLMALAYGTTTPIGQAIGLAIHRLYDPASQTGLLTVGFMNAISSGLLLFAGLVELLAEDFLSDESYVILKGGRRLQACASVVGGAGLMALVGAWA